MSSFTVLHRSFEQLLGEKPQLDLLLENKDYPFAHEAGVFIPQNNTLFITSNQYPDPKNPSTIKIQITKVTIAKDGTTTAEEIQTENVINANGGVNYKNGILFCAQGNKETLSGLSFMETEPPYRSSPLLTSFYGRNFNSVNDVVVHSDGSVWFTDPEYGPKQGICPPAQNRNQVYRWDGENGGGVRAVADGFGRPNGICFSPDEKTVYITDTAQILGNGTIDLTGPASVYAFDIAYYHAQPFLINRRLFAFADTGVPDGIKCDTSGNVYAGCGDGVNVWSPGGVLLGKIVVEGGVANFCFGRNGELFLLNERKLWRARIGSHVKGALLGI